MKEKGAIHLFIPLILLLGLIAGVYLITSGNPLKFFSRASNPPIVFKDLSGNPLPLNSNGISRSTSKEVRVELTSTLGPPASVSGPISGPNPTGTISYKTGFEPVELGTGFSISYTKEPTVYAVTFKDTSGVQFYWVEFKDITGKTDRRSAQIEIVLASPSPSPSPSPSQAASATPAPTSETATTVKIRAWGRPANGVNPKIQLYDGSKYLSAFETKATSRQQADVFTYTFPRGASFKQKPQIKFINDYWRPPLDRNAYIDYIEINGVRLEAEDAKTYSVGSWNSSKSIECGGGYAEREVLACNGFFRFQQYSPISTPAPEAAKRVFVTSATYNGNLGGLSGADAKCQVRANVANLGGTWKAWLADATNSPQTTFNKFSGPYRRIDGVAVASNWKDLTDGSLQNGITVTEIKTSYTNTLWSNTSYYGGPGGPNCGNWTSVSSSVIGTAATGGSTTSDWTGYGTKQCSSYLPIYCFEQ